MASKAVSRRSWRRVILGVATVLLVALLVGLSVLWRLQYRPPQDGRSWDDSPPAAVADNLDWQAVGGDSGQEKFSPLAQITPENVGRLERVWTYSTGEVARRGDTLTIARTGDRRIDVVRAGAAAIWGSGIPIYGLRVPAELYSDA